MTTIRTFDESTMDRLAAMLREWERLPPDAPNRGGRGVSPSAREVRFARTTTNYYYPTYPTSGPAYVVELGQYDPSPDPPYPGATITNTFTPYDPEWKVIAVDPTAGTLIANTTVVRIDKHDGRWWIIPAAAAVASVAPIVFYDTSFVITSGASKPRGGGYNTTEYDTVVYNYTRGSRTANQVTPMLAVVAQDPFVEILTTGRYLVTVSVRSNIDSDYTGTANGDETNTYTTSGPSTGTSHTHTVATYAGTRLFGEWQSTFRKRVGSGGAWGTINESAVKMVGVIQPVYNNLSNNPNTVLVREMILTLTAGWQITHRISFSGNSQTDQTLDPQDSILSIQYLGDNETAVAIT